MAAPLDREVARARDPREDEEWFARLPAAVQARCIAAWERERRGLTLDPAPRRRAMVRGARESAILLAVLVLFVNAFQFGSFGQVLAVLALGAAAGAVVGAILGAGQHGRFRAGTLGATAFTLVQVPGTCWYDLLDLVTLSFGALLAINCYGVYGLRLEDRARPGSGM